MQLTEQFWHNLVHVCGLGSGKALVAVSGGPDSVALLYLLQDNIAKMQIEPIVAHVDHRLRPESQADEAFCRELAEALGVPYLSRSVAVKKVAAQQKMSIELAARALRYQALHDMALQHGCRAILLGHTADDQAETVLHNLSRGAGIRGLAGMPFRHGILLRPLLDITKENLFRYLDARKISYRQDGSNSDLHFRRNRIRHTVLPHLQRELNPRITAALCRIAANAGEAELYIDSMAQDESKNVLIAKNPNKIILDIERISGYFPVLRKYIIRNSLEALSERSVRPDFDALQRAEQLISAGKIGKRTTLSGQWELLIDHDGIVIWDGKQRTFEFACRENETVYLSENTTFKYSLLSALPSPNSLKSHGDTMQYIDASEIKGRIRIRSAKRGDRYRPLGLNGSKLVSDLLADRKVPLHKRSEIPVVVCETGIIWVVGFQIDERFKVTSQTESLLQMEFKETGL